MPFLRTNFTSSNEAKLVIHLTVLFFTSIVVVCSVMSSKTTSENVLRCNRDYVVSMSTWIQKKQIMPRSLVILNSELHVPSDRMVQQTRIEELSFPFFADATAERPILQSL